MPAFRYNRKADIRDQQAAAIIRKDPNYYSGHSDQHLKNALRFARGCAGSEAKAREEAIQAEIKRRS